MPTVFTTGSFLDEERKTTNDSVLNQLSALESARKDGLLTLPGGETLKVTNLHKLFWPKLKLTKGDLLRYYVRVAPFILPAVADRPLVMKRFAPLRIYLSPLRTAVVCMAAASEPEPDSVKP